MLVSNVKGLAWDEYEGAGSSLGEGEKKRDHTLFGESEEELF